MVALAIYCIFLCHSAKAVIHGWGLVLCCSKKKLFAVFLLHIKIPLLLHFSGAMVSRLWLPGTQWRWVVSFLSGIGKISWPCTHINTSRTHKLTFNKAASGGPYKLPIIWTKYCPPSQASILPKYTHTNTRTHLVTLAARVQSAFYPCLFRCTRGHNGGALAALGLTAAVISLWLPHASYLTLNSLSGMRTK